MRVLLSTWGSRGDVEPMLGFGVALQRRGAEVRLCAPPDFADLAGRAGVPMVPAGQSVRDLVHGAKPSSAADAPRVAAALVAMKFSTVAEAAQGCDVVVASGLMPAGERSIAEKFGLRYVCAVLNPRSLPSPYYPPLGRPGRALRPDETGIDEQWQVDAERVQALYGDAVDLHRAAIGLSKVSDVRDHVFTDRPWLATDPILAPWLGSPALEPIQTGAWILPDARPIPLAVDAFLARGEPPVYVGMGSVRAPKDVARVAIEAIRAQGRRVIVGCGWADLELIDDRDDCLAVAETNHQALFTRVAAVIHHGGAGTTTTAAVAGVPQVVVPQMADQPFWASRVADLRIGAAHEGSSPTVESLSTALEVALAPETRMRASAVAAAVRTDGASVAAKLLLDGC